MATLPVLTLMLRAATGLARRCAEVLTDRGGVYGRRVLLLVGAGNNGGDALFAGALLARRGVDVRAVLLVPDRAHQEGLAALRRAGGRVEPGLSALDDSTVDIVVDGVVGIGATGTLRGSAAEAAERLTAVRARAPRPAVVAVDVPSGVDVDTGAVEGPVLQADVTVTFGCLKPAHVVGPAAPLAGQVDLVDIGLPRPQADPAVFVPDIADIAGWWPVPNPGSDKYTRGVAGLATGSRDFPGAALMSTSGALAGPAGMVRYAGPIAADVIRAHPSVVISERVADTGRVQAWLVGCGLGTDDRARDELRAVLGSPVPAILDADALTLAGEGPLADRLRKRSAPTVVTPHDREYARLAGQSVGPDRVAAARLLAHRLGVVVLLKGDRTVVASPDGRAWANPSGSAALATAGTGDVLAGLLVSLLAAGLPAERAALVGVFVHGLAGRHAAERFSAHGNAPVTAPDVAAAVPAVIATLAKPTDR